MLTRTALGLALVATASAALAATYAHTSASQSAYNPAPIVRQVHPVDGCNSRVTFPAC